MTMPELPIAPLQHSRPVGDLEAAKKRIVALKMTAAILRAALRRRYDGRLCGANGCVAGGQVGQAGDGPQDGQPPQL